MVENARNIARKGHADGSNSVPNGGPSGGPSGVPSGGPSGVPSGGPSDEPNDVTVELDGLGRQLSELPAGARPVGVGVGGAVPEAGHEGSDGPVFVDESGRRSRKLRKAGWFVALGCACYAVTVAVALVGGNSDAPWLPIPGLAEKRKADSVEIQPGVTASRSVSASPGAPAAEAPALTPDSDSDSGAPAPDDPAATGPRSPGKAVPAGAGAAAPPAPGASAPAAPVTDPRTGPAPAAPSASAPAATSGSTGGATGGGPSPSEQTSDPGPTPSDPAPSTDPGLDGGGQDLAVAKGAR